MKRVVAIFLLVPAIAIGAINFWQGAAAKKKAVVSVTPDDVNTFLNFHLETNDTVVSDGFWQSAYGETNYWDRQSQIETNRNYAIWTNTTGPDITLPTPIRTPDGVVHYSTGTNWIRGNLGSTNGWESFNFNYPDSWLVTTKGYLYISLTTNNTTANSRDLFLLYDNPYAVLQAVWSGVGSVNVVPHGGMHSSIGAIPGTKIEDYVQQQIFHWELTQDSSNAVAFFTLRSTNNYGVLWSSIAYGTNNLLPQGLFRIMEGYITEPGLSGYTLRNGISVAYSNKVSQARPPWVPPAVTGLTASQYTNKSITVSWVDHSDELNPTRIDVFHGSTWMTNWTSATPSLTNVIVSGLTNGETYKVRAYGYFEGMVFSNYSAFVESGNITLTNIPDPVWYYTIAVADTDTSELSDSGLRHHALFTSTNSGTCDMLSVYSAQTIGLNSGIKIALFDASKNLIVAGTNTFSAQAAGDITVSIAPTAVTGTPGSPTTYYIGFITDTASVLLFRYKDNDSTRLYKFADYGSFPGSTIAEDGSQSRNYRSGMRVTP